MSSPIETKLFIYGVDIGASISRNNSIENICEKLLNTRSKKDLGPYYKIKSDLTDGCNICLENYKNGLYYRELKCNHKFHKKCIDKWIKSGKNTCPVCRNVVY